MSLFVPEWILLLMGESVNQRIILLISFREIDDVLNAFTHPEMERVSGQIMGEGKGKWS